MMKKSFLIGILCIMLVFLCSCNDSKKTIEFVYASNSVSEKDAERMESIIKNRLKNYGYNCRVHADTSGVSVSAPKNVDEAVITNLLTCQGNFYLISQYGESGMANFIVNDGEKDIQITELSRPIHEVVEDKGIIVGNNHITGCELGEMMDMDKNEISVVSIVLDNNGQKILAEATTNAYKNRESIAIYLDKILYSVSVSAVITDGRFIISNFENDDDAKVVYSILKSGVLPCEIARKNVNGSSESVDNKGFIHDWSEGNANYYGYGLLEDWNRWHDYHNYVIQDKTMYYADQCDFKPKIYKKQIDSDSVSIVATVTEENRPIIYIIGVVEDYIYYEIYNVSSNMPNSIYRIRTDGEYNEFLTKHCGQGGSPYIVGNKLFFMSYEQKGAQTYVYQLTCMNVENKETKVLVSDTEKDFLQFGYKDYLFCKTTKADNVTSSGKEPTITIYKLDGSLYNKMIPGTFQSLIDPEKDVFTFKKYYTSYGENGWETMSLKGVEQAYDDWLYSRHSKEYIIDVKPSYYGVPTELTIVYRNKKEKKLNDDMAWEVYGLGDGYVYYECDSVHYRIRTDGTGWENVSWMYP